jgi:probable phosphoglycerate mutase
MKKTVLIVIRHGETVWNLEKRIQGHLDSDLTDRGYAQARSLARAFSTIRIDALYCSDLGRAVKTVAAIESATGLSATHLACLRESNLGVLQGKTREEIEEDFPDEYDLFRLREPDFVLPEGESLVQRHQRAIFCLSKLVMEHDGKVVCAVTHGGILDSLLRHTLDISLKESRRFSISNCAINTFWITDGIWEMVEWGNVSHLNGI